MKGTKGKNISLKIDGKKYFVPECITVLEAVRSKGIYIPTLCYLENLLPYGGCRLCVVKIKDMQGYPTACTTPVSTGMEITTISNELQELRREILELILSEHPYTCLTCKEKTECKEFMHSTRKVSITTGCNFCASNGDCELQELVDYLQLSDVKYPVHYRGIDPQHNNPFYDIDYNLCILCGRCVRICNEERNSEVLAFVQRGNTTIVGTAFGESQKDAGCEFCGACVDVCPTGSISEKMGKWVGLPDRSTETTCLFCPVGCTINVNSRNNRIINVGPKPRGRINPPQICVRGKFVPGDIIHHPDRIQTPLIKKEGKWVEVSWKEAISYTAGNLKRHKGNQFGMIGSAHDSLEDSYVMQKFARKIMGSNNVDLLASYPNTQILENIHNYYSTFPPPIINSIDEADTIFIIGSNGSLSHPIVENRIRKAYRNQTEIIFANPYHNRTSTFASQNLIYNLGEELLLLLTMISGLLEKKTGRKTEILKQQLKELHFNKACKKLGIPATRIRSTIRSISNSNRLLIIAGDRLFRSQDCIDNFNALYNLQLLHRDPDSCRILFLLNEGNIYGGTFAGMAPGFLPGFDQLDNEKNLKKWSSYLKVKLDNLPGLSGNEMVNHIQVNGITSLFINGDIPDNPKLSHLKFLVQQNMFLTETSKHAHVFFPATSFLETKGHIVDLERKLKKTKPVIKPLTESKPLWKTLSAIARVMQEEGFNYKQQEDIFNELKAHTDISLKSNNKLMKNFLPVEVKYSVKRNDYPLKVGLEYNHFNYMGNLLSSLINDVREISDEGIVNISHELANNFKVKDGDTVKLITEYGEIIRRVKKNNELNNDHVFVTINGNEFNKNLNNQNQSFLFAKIEKC